MSASDSPNHRPIISKRPAYRQVMDAMSEMVKGKSPGERLGTEGDFVRHFGVSLVTVRQALARLENDGVIERRQGLGTFIPVDPLPRRHVAVQNEGSLAHAAISPYFRKLHEEIGRTLRARGHSCRSYFGDSTPEEALSGRFSCPELVMDYRLGRLSGVIAIGVGTPRAHLEPYGEVEIPIFDSRVRGAMGWDRKITFLKEAFSALRAQGRQRIAMLAWENPTLQARPFHTDVVRIAREHGIELQESQLDLCASALEEGMGWERFRDLWRNSERKPDGLIILDDTIFDDCQKAIIELGLSVPEQLGLFLYTSDARRLNPVLPVTCYRIETALVAENYVDAFEALLRGEQPVERRLAGEVVCLPEQTPSDETLLQPYLLNL